MLLGIIVPDIKPILIHGVWKPSKISLQYHFYKPKRILPGTLESSRWSEVLHYGFRWLPHCVFETPFLRTVALFTRQDWWFWDLKLSINIQVYDGLNHNILSLGQMLWKIGMLLTFFDWWTVTSVENQFCGICAARSLPFLLKVMTFEKDTCLGDEDEYFRSWRDLRDLLF